MPMYVKATDNTVIKYPYSLGDMLVDNPTVSFAQPISLETAAEYDTFLVEEIPAPSYDPISQNLIATNPDFVGGVWVQTWAVENATPAEIAQRLEQKRQAMVISPLQAKVELLERELLDEVEAVIAASTDPVIVLAWNSATQFARLSPLVLMIAEELEWDDAYLDNLFVEAAQRTF